MRLATSQQCREIDDLSVKVYGLTSDLLMEAAGTLAAREIQLSFFPELSKGNVAIICGGGNNGGDGLVVARHLHSMGFRDISIYLLADFKKRSDLFKLQLKRADLHGLRIIDLAKQPSKISAIKSATLIVDAIFGIGFKGSLKPSHLKCIEMLNALRIPIVSLDTPSGLDSDRGIVEQTAIRAHTTLTFGLAKPGFFTGDGPMHVGKLRVLSIGYPHESLRGVATTHFLFHDRLAKRYLPKRKDKSNKSDYGQLVVFAGSEGTWGAGVLASHAAYRMGTGYVYWASHSTPSNEIKAVPEVITASVGDDKVWDKNKVSAWVVGPGLGTDSKTVEIIKKLKKIKAERVLVDADALTVAARENLFPFPKSWVITPHAAELARIIGGDVKSIEKDRFAAALKAAQMSGCHVLLKGFRSIIAYEDRCMVIQSGNSALAKAGSGDILSGMIGGLLAQELDSLQATATGAFLHGKLADEWVREGLDRSGLMPSDLAERLPSLLARVASSVIF